VRLMLSCRVVAYITAFGMTDMNIDLLISYVDSKNIVLRSN
jgi:hypothetical protein